jgi:hypothetical protein
LEEAAPPTEVGLTDKVMSWVNAVVQLGVALVTVMPVILKVWPLLAAVRAGVVKEATPEALATTFVAVCGAPPLMVKLMVEVVLARRPVKLIVAEDPAQTVADCVAPLSVGVGLTVICGVLLIVPPEVGQVITEVAKADGIL